MGTPQCQSGAVVDFCPGNVTNIMPYIIQLYNTYIHELIILISNNYNINIHASTCFN